MKVPEGVLVMLRVERPGIDAVWLAKRCAPEKPYYGLWAAPGGSIEPGEVPLVAAVREVEEETGLWVKPDRLVFGSRVQYAYDDGKPFIMHRYDLVLTEEEKPRAMEPHKQGEWTLFSLDETPETTPGTAEGLRALARAQ